MELIELECLPLFSPTTTRFIELAGEINTYMPYYVIQKTLEALNKNRKSIKGAKVLILGLAYKKNVDEPRESPSLKLIELLQEMGAEVDYHDPYIPRPPKMRKYKLEKSSVPLTAESLKKYDCVVIATDHADYAPELILENSRIIVDTRNLMKNLPTNSDRVTKA